MKEGVSHPSELVWKVGSRQETDVERVDASHPSLRRVPGAYLTRYKSVQHIGGDTGATLTIVRSFNKDVDGFTG